MRTKLKLIILLFLIIAGIQAGFSKVPSNSIVNFFYTDVTVGTKTSDSSGTVTINSSVVQQSIISTIAVLNGYQITDQPSLLVTPATGYLIFKATNSAGEQISVAVEVILSNSSFIYRSTSFGEVHTCKSFGNCAGCNFLTMGNRIVSCNCTSASATAESNCSHSATWKH